MHFADVKLSLLTKTGGKENADIDNTKAKKL
jgi:hypothetical protein